ncbi:hypothetical protein WMF30_54325 [Sorangium sp. So ce134]
MEPSGDGAAGGHAPPAPAAERRGRGAAEGGVAWLKGAPKSTDLQRNIQAPVASPAVASGTVGGFSKENVT